MTDSPLPLKHTKSIETGLQSERSILLQRQLGLLLLSCGGVVLEIALTRLFSTLFYPPYVFAVISLAILGIGLGAAAATWRPALRSTQNLPFYGLLTGFGTLALLLAIIVLAGSPGWVVVLLLVPLPYLFVGLTLATLFAAAAQNVGQLYRADLIGAGLGALLAIPLLNLLNPLNSLIAMGGLFGLSGLLFRQSLPLAERQRWIQPVSALLGVLVVGLLAFNLSQNRLSIDPGRLQPPKPISESLLAGGQIIDTRWDSFARTDLVDPGGGRPYELYIDGAAGSVMPRAGDLNLLRNDIGFFPFATTMPDSVLIIGPGGGLDIAFALAVQADSITALEINQASIDMVNDYAAFNGGLYSQPNLRVEADEGRSLLRREAQQYDMIYLSQVVTLAAERNGYALTENTVYTVEAFTDYLNHLNADGQIVLKLYDELTLTRALVSAASALATTRDISDAEAMAHIAAFVDPRADPPIPLLTVQARPFEPNEALAYAGIAAEVGFAPLFVPNVVDNPDLSAVLTGQQSLDDLIASSTSNISPTTDDRPFFYQFEPGLPLDLRRLLIAFGGLLGLAIVALLLTQRQVTDRSTRTAPLYFAALGAGFITIEIAIIQQTRLFLGHPTLAVTTILAVLLIGGGLGAGFAPSVAATPRKRWLMLLVGIVILTGLWQVVWAALAPAMVSAVTPVRVGVVVVSLLPLAFLMGLPFPLGLRALGQSTDGARHIALAWTVNGVMSVVGTVAAVAIALLAGFGVTMIFGAGCYLLAALYVQTTTG